jgi:outer membrane receptor protein involved in Fe transport
MLLFGAEWRHSDGRYRYRDEAEFDLVFDIPDTQAEDSRAHHVNYRPSGDQYGLYASLRAEIAQPLALEGGIRWDRSTLGGDDNLWSPRASVLYRPNESTFLRASWGRFIQTQSIDELPASDGVSAFAPAQRADHWLVGFEQRLGEQLDLRIEGYSKRYSNLRPRFENLLNEVVILPELKPDRIRIAPASARASGVEVSLRSVRSRPLFWWASYTWSQVQDIFPDRKVRRSWDHRHALSCGLGYEGERWELSAAGTWRSGSPSTALELVATDDGELVVHASSANTQQLKPYLDIDARVARKFRFDGGSSLTAFFEISNVLNRRNECCMEFEIEDESADESAEPQLVTESIRSLPLLPSLGVVWRF